MIDFIVDCHNELRWFILYVKYLFTTDQLWAIVLEYYDIGIMIVRYGFVLIYVPFPHIKS
jgi:hypothetical protein